jgi:hypothetical protein
MKLNENRKFIYGAGIKPAPYYLLGRDRPVINAKKGEYFGI